MHQFQIPLYEQMRERDRDFYAALEKVGVMHDWGDDGSGLFMKYLRRGSGYYIDRRLRSRHRRFDQAHERQRRGGSGTD
jgi:cation diffusion facilitator CzcD-associated flavoprotein CzcO